MKRPIRLLLALVAVLALLAAACGDDDDDRRRPARPTPPRRRRRCPTARRSPSAPRTSARARSSPRSTAGPRGRRLRRRASRSSAASATSSSRPSTTATINFAPEYAASMLEFLNEQEGEATGDVDETVELLQGYLDDKGLTALDAVRRGRHQRLRRHQGDGRRARARDAVATWPRRAPTSSSAAPPDCETNPFCIPGSKTVYGVDLQRQLHRRSRPAPSPTPSTPARSTSACCSRPTARIATKGWVLLEDDKHMLAADNVVPVVTDELVDAYGDEFVDAVERDQRQAHHRGAHRAEQALRRRQGGRRPTSPPTGSRTTT